MAEQAGVAPSAQSVGESLMAKLAQLQRVDAVSRLLRPHYPDDSVCGPLASAVVAEVGRARTFDRFACRLVDADGPSASLAELPLRVLHRLFLAARSGPPAAAPPGVDAPVVSFDSLRRARTTLDDFSKFYLPLHGLAQVDFFRWLPQLTFVEAAISSSLLRLFIFAFASGCGIPKIPLIEYEGRCSADRSVPCIGKGAGC